MIRKLEVSEIDVIAQIWLDTNVTAHDFISSGYWQSKLKEVKKSLCESEVYAIEEEGKICGFIGMDQNYILGLFVISTMQTKGMGKKLLDFAKNIRKELQLNVYQKNIKAINFYQYQGFQILHEDFDKATNEKEYVMQWKI